MNDVVSTRCYVEEYEVEPGRMGVRLREKGTGRKVGLGTAGPQEKQHLLQFLVAALTFKETMPDLVSMDGKRDCVLIEGHLDFDAPDEIRFIYDSELSYLFA